MTFCAFHPGAFLAEELEERGMFGDELARALNIPQNRVSEILNGKRAVTVDTAGGLGRRDHAPAVASRPAGVRMTQATL